MSCFICDEKHISALAGFAENAARRDGGSKSAREIAKILYDANVRSFNARYEGRYQEDIAPFEFDAQAAARVLEVPPVAVIVSAQCFDYQACEFEEWEASEARKIIDSIIKDAIRRLPGYEKASWGSPV